MATKFGRRVRPASAALIFVLAAAGAAGVAGTASNPPILPVGLGQGQPVGADAAAADRQGGRVHHVRVPDLTGLGKRRADAPEGESATFFY